MLFVFYWFLELIEFMVPITETPSPETIKAMGITNFDALTGAAREAALERIVIPERLAMFHTMFNFTNICLLIAFVPVIEKITCLILKGGPDRKRRTSLQRIEYLTSNIAEMGELALFEGQKELVKLAELSGEMFNGFVYVMQNPDKDLSEKVSRLRDLEQDSDKISMALTNFFVKCSSHELSQNSIKTVTRNMLIVPELEEMCDACYRLITLARKRYKRQFFDQMLQSAAFIDFCNQMNSFVEFASAVVFEKRNGIFQAEYSRSANFFSHVLVSFSSHYCTTSKPIERAEPIIIILAASTSFAFKSFIFLEAISRTCCMVT